MADILRNASIARPDIERTPADIREIGEINRPIDLAEAIFAITAVRRGLVLVALAIVMTHEIAGRMDDDCRNLGAGRSRERSPDARSQHREARLALHCRAGADVDCDKFRCDHALYSQICFLDPLIVPKSTRFAVAIHTLAALAVSDGKPLRSEDLAFSAATNAAVIRSLLSRLHEAKLTISQLGAGGGALLAKPPEKIRLLDVYRAVEDTELFAFHRGTPCQQCPVGAHIQDAMRPVMDRAQRAFEAELAKTSIADVAADLARRGNFTIPLSW